MELNKKFFQDVEQMKNIDLSPVVEHIITDITNIIDRWVGDNVFKICGYIPSLENKEIWASDWKIIIQNIDFQSNLYQLFFENKPISLLYISLDNGKISYKIEYNDLVN